MLRRSLGLLLASVFVGLTGCQTDNIPPTAPSGPPAQLKGMAVAIDVDLAANSASVRPLAAAGRGASGASFALLGRNEITATTANLTRSRVGEFSPGRV